MTIEEKLQALAECGLRLRDQFGVPDLVAPPTSSTLGGGLPSQFEDGSAWLRPVATDQEVVGRPGGRRSQAGGRSQGGGGSESPVGPLFPRWIETRGNE